MANAAESEARRGSDSNGLVGRVLERVERDLGADRYERYFGGHAKLEFGGGCWRVTVPSGFHAKVIDSRFADTLRRAVREETGGADGLDGGPGEGTTVPLSIHVDRGAFDGLPGRAEPAARQGPGSEPAVPTEPPSRARRTGRAGSRFHLDQFVVGECNRLAYTTARRIAQGDGARAFCPLFVHGGCGLGKTHLLQGIAGEFRRRAPGAVVRYLTGESFTNAYISAVQAGRIEQFRRTYRNVDLLCVDDVHFLSNKKGTQSELLHTFDALDLDDSLVVLASDEHPRSIQRLSESLRSRFLSGAVVRLDEPDVPMRRTLVTQLAARRGLPLDEAAAALLAERSALLAELTGTGSVRDLEGMLTQIEAVYRLLPDLCGTPGRIGPVLVSKALGLEAPGGSARGAARKPIRVERVSAHVTRTLGVDPIEVMGRGRHARVVLARGLIAHLARELTTLSYPEIAKAMGRPNHSSVVTMVNRIRSQIEAGRVVDVGPGLSQIELSDLVEQLAERIRRDA